MDHESGSSKGVPLKLQNYFMKQMLREVSLISADAEITMFQAWSKINAHVESM